MEHGNYTSRVINSYSISKEIYNYLLPVYGLSAIDKKYPYPTIEERKEGWFFYGTKYQHEDMLARIKYFD